MRFYGIQQRKKDNDNNNDEKSIWFENAMKYRIKV